MLSTIKTTLGFLVEAIQKHTPLKFGGDQVGDVFNYLLISDRIASSGQPTVPQFRSIQNAGYQTVINLAPNSVLENSIKTERSLLEELGLNYIHISVDFTNPTEHDYLSFVEAMQTKTDDKIWVHCAANMRVSAFLYRYRTNVLGEQESDVRSDLTKIWQPIGIWKKFISQN